MDNIKERKPHDNIQHKLAELPGLLKIEPLFTGIVNRDSGEIHGMNRAFDSVNWIKKDAVIIGSDGKEKFRQNDVEVPDWWNDTTINIVAEKYFRVVNGVKENSAKQMFHRVASWLRDQAIAQKVLDSVKADVFYNELLYMFVNGMHAFNSPVWFNMGVVENPQNSACFIISVEDTMESITDLAKTEVMLFKGGSGTGTNLSTLRSSYSTLSNGGKPSGPVSFMKGYDSWAGVTKSGGAARRAAKMAILNIDHPDILEQANGEAGFITCKSRAEQIAADLYSTGKYTAEWNKPGNVYDLVNYQNANNSVRVTDEFMSAVEKDLDWTTKEVKTGKPVKTYKARQLMNEIAQAAWLCGDPGIQFDTKTNEWHTCPTSGKISSSNPCQPAWATVLTPEGIRTFEEINVGSTIWSGKQWTKITRKISTGIKPVYRFYTRAGIFAGTEEHKVICNGERIEARFAENIDTAQYCLLDKNFFMDAQAIIDGLVLGDGYVKVSNDGNNHYPLLCIGKNDQSYFEDFQLSEFINSTPFDKLAHRVKTTLTKDELPRTYLRKIPARYFSGDSIKVASFLRGLYSANGSIVGNRVTLKASSFVVISQVQEMLSSIGIRSYYTVNKSTDVEFDNGVYTSKESYDLNISTDRNIFCKWIGFIQPYKQEKLTEALTIKSSAKGPKTSYEIVARQLVGEEPVFDIEVEAEEHTYWTGGLLVSNCSEYLFLDDTSCNLSSLNLLRFADGKKFNIDLFIHACELATIAKELIVDGSSYPSPKLTENSHKFRTLGLGYTNLGALLTYWGLPYDSNEGRAVTAAITAVMTGAAYRTSAELARVQGPFSEYEKNKSAMLNVISKHWDAAKRLPSLIVKEWQVIIDKAYEVWKEAYDLGIKYGYRNAQTTVLAPTGSISFLMGAETTGIEPMMSCIVYKKVVGEGLLILPNGVIEPALKNLGYTEDIIKGIMEHIRKTNTIHGAPGFLNIHGPIFAESLGDHALSPNAHVDMMTAVQPFLSGGISKTVNMPSNATAKDITDIYMRAWKGGLKCIAVYRDGCKLSQPIATEFTDKSKATKKMAWGERKKLPQTCNSIRHKMNIGAQEGYLHVGLYPDGSLGEIFVETAKQGSALMGFVDAWAQAVSIGIQHGVPFEVLKEKFIDMKFEPSGFTDCDEIRIAKSIPDYIFRWIEKFIINKENATNSDVSVETTYSIAPISYDGPPCSKCSNMTRRAGSCYVCMSCGSTTGCS